MDESLRVLCAAGQKELSASTKASLLRLLANPAVKWCVESRVRREAEHVMPGSLRLCAMQSPLLQFTSASNHRSKSMTQRTAAIPQPAR